jgi:hypothetical protein
MLVSSGATGHNQILAIARLHEVKLFFSQVIPGVRMKGKSRCSTTIQLRAIHGIGIQDQDGRTQQHRYRSGFVTILSGSQLQRPCPIGSIPVARESCRYLNSCIGRCPRTHPWVPFFFIDLSCCRGASRSAQNSTYQTGLRM